MPSQYGEESLILPHFGERVGRFLDVGAFDGYTFSNTYCLAERGWKGVLIEPSPAAFVHLMKRYEGNPSLQLINAGLMSHTAGLYPFMANGVNDAADALSTFVEAHRTKHPKHPFRELWVCTINWDMLIDRFPGPYDFINIDVEGMNPEILSGMCDRMAQLKPELVCVEMDPESEARWMEWKLERAGLIHHSVVGGNLLAWK